MVSFALCDASGTPLGRTPPLPLARTSGWVDAAALVTAARERWGLELVVLRLVDARVTRGVRHLRYSAEVQDAARTRGLDMQTVETSDFDDHPLRMPWARPGGPARDLAWANSALAARGIRAGGVPVQIRTWNLSSLWRLPVAGGAVWLKSVPPFFAHEGAVIEQLQGHPVPRLIARTGAMCLLADVDGVDLYEPDLGSALRMVDLIVDLQSSAALPPGAAPPLPDWRVSALRGSAEHALRHAYDALDTDERRTLAALVGGLDDRAVAIEECGLPDGIVHGDFHPGNLRGTTDRMTLLDWGDSGWGHPLLDVAAFTERLPDVAAAAAVRAHWLGRWGSLVPGSEPARALALIAPVAALRQAIVYQGFLDRIEPSERVYHADDPATWMRTASALLAD